MIKRRDYKFEKEILKLAKKGVSRYQLIEKFYKPASSIDNTLARLVREGKLKIIYEEQVRPVYMGKCAKKIRTYYLTEIGSKP
jgi:hypothetical protein